MDVDGPTYKDGGAVAKSTVTCSTTENGRSRKRELYTRARGGEETMELINSWSLRPRLALGLEISKSGTARRELVRRTVYNVRVCTTSTYGGCPVYNTRVPRTYYGTYGGLFKRTISRRRACCMCARVPNVYMINVGGVACACARCRTHRNPNNSPV